MSVYMMTPPHHPECYPKRIWEDTQVEHSTRQCSEQGRVSLPSIRQAFPELQPMAYLEPPVNLQRDWLPRTPPLAISPTGAQFGPITPPEYIVSPSRCKRRRVSSDEELEFNRASQVPRPYAVAHQAVPQPQSPSLESPLPLMLWTDSGSSSPCYNGYSVSLPIRPAESVNAHGRAEPNFEPAHTREEYVLASPGRFNCAPSNGYSADVGGHGYRLPSYGHGYHHPNRTQSLSAPSARPGRTPFPPGGYGYNYQETQMGTGNLGTGTNGEGKPRKRRGNLPKEITDKLRKWFVAHLMHPYPTEDEKQELMRQTGLKMNQISNWYINARRRQLPHMINNALAEKDAMNSRSADGKALSSGEHKDHDREGTEGSVHGDTETKSKSHPTPSLKRGSI
ncbi:hypothetical protein F5B21DRAFT_292644 [Xylaria acuta]|nr:hypothetical protein F5B21DRAFT_292644 [Xylaria acuta]